MHRVSTFTLAALALAPASVLAAGLEYNVDVGIGHTDNITRTSTNQQSDTLAALGTEFSLLHKTRRLSADLTGDLSYVEYLNNTFDSELVGSFGAAVLVGLVEERLSWALDDSFGQTRLDPFVPVTPANRENVNRFSTGPDLTLRFSAAMRLNAQARYTRLDYQTSPFDQDRYGGLLGLERELSGTNRVSLNVTGERVKPQAGGGSDYTRSEAFVRYTADAARTRLNAELGAARVSGTGDRSNDLLARLNLSRKVGAFSTFTLRARHDITDTGNTLGQGGGVQLPRATLQTGMLSQTDRPFVNDAIGASWTAQGRLTRATLSADWTKEDYSSVGVSDRKYITASAGLARRFGPRLEGRLSYYYTRNEFSAVVNHTTENTGEVGFDWRLGRRLSADFSATRTDHSDTPLFASSPETRLWLRLRYGDRISRE